MQIETLETTAHPMIYVTRQSSMDPDEIGKALGEAFAVLGAFLGESGVRPVSPPISVYRDWQDGKMSIDVGMPVAAADTAKVTGEVKAGETPACRAIRAVHKGPYERLRDTYGELETEMSKAGMKQPDFAWEVYITDPDSTAADELLTEIYMPIQ